MADSPTLRSVPALAVAWRQRDLAALLALDSALTDLEKLVPMYRIDGADEATEAAAAAHLASDVAERLRRLAYAYGEWAVFEPAPYFDLLPAQATQLVSVVERVATVHVTFFVDLLLPSYQSVAGYLARILDVTEVLDGSYVAHQRELENRWLRLLAVLDRARRHLADDVGYLALNGANEERNRWRAAWDLGLATPPLAALPFAHVPSLTLSVDFPLPANRQPGRLRRLRRARARRRPSATLRRRAL